MKNLLFISSYPFPLDMGCNQHAYYILRALNQIFKIYCIFFVPPHKLPYQHNKTELQDLNIKDYKLCYFKKHTQKNKYFNFLQQVSAFPSYYMKLAKTQYGILTIKEFIKKYSIDIVHFEHFHYTNYAFRIKDSIKKVMVYHDLHHTIFKQKMRFEKKFFRKFLLFQSFLKYYFFERLLEKKIDTKIFLNPIEMKSLPINSIYIPHIANPKIIFRKTRNKRFFNILFLGAYNHPPNRVSFKYIIEKIIPELIKTTNNFKIHVIGSDTEKFKKKLRNFKYRDLVFLHGFVKDINKVFENMDIALFPILYGGGIKTKVIDAMAAGLPVVTTPQGVTGLESVAHQAVGVGSTTNEILGELNTLMNNYSLRLMRSEMGKAYVEEHHSYNVFAAKIKEVYIGI